MKRSRIELAIVIPLALAAVASGVWVIRAKHQARQLFIELEELNREHDRLQVDWGRLQLEQSTWANHPRIEAFARERLQMDTPHEGDVHMLAEGSR